MAVNVIFHQTLERDISTKEISIELFWYIIREFITF